ncbi:MAG: hypothetical protein EU539_13460, partial [Promethearchaeota archaeon]
MGFSGISTLRKRKNRIYLLIVSWLLIGIFISAFRPQLAMFILNPLIGFCVALFIISLFTDMKEITLPIALVILVISVILAINLFIFREIVEFLFNLAIISYILITALFTLYGCYEGGKAVDKYLYNRSSPLNHILRWIEFLGGVFLSINIITFAFFFTGGRLILMYQIIFWTIIILAAFSLIFLLVGKFNAWLGTFSMYAGIYFFYLVVVFIFRRQIFAEPGVYPLLIILIFALLDIIILLYTIGILVGKRAEVISKKVKLFR